MRLFIALDFLYIYLPFKFLLSEWLKINGRSRGSFAANFQQTLKTSANKCSFFTNFLYFLFANTVTLLSKICVSFSFILNIMQFYLVQKLSLHS